MHNRWVMVVVMVVAGFAWADVPGPKPYCSAPPECVGCSLNEATCVGSAIDAGLVETDCKTQRGVPVTYYCPPGVKPVQTCGCSGSAGAGAVLFGALLLVRRRLTRG